MQIFFFLPPQQNKSAECWQLITLEGYSIKAAIFAREAQREWQSDNVSATADYLDTFFYVQREGECLNVASVESWRWGDIMT